MVQRKRGRVAKARKSSCSLQRPNVWVVLSVALLVIVLTVITSLGPSSVTGYTVQNIGRMNKGDPLQLAVRDVPGLEIVFTNADEIIQSGKITVEVDESITFDRLYVNKFKVSSENKFGPLQFRFKVKEQDLLDQGISRGDLRLYHGVKEYSLQLLKVDHGYLYYIVTVPSMGSFVLGRVPEVKNETVVKEEEAPAKEQVPTTAEEVPVEEPEESLVGKAVEEPAPMPEKEGLWSRIARFFRNLFS